MIIFHSVSINIYYVLQTSEFLHLSAFCLYSWHVCIVGGGSSGGRREMPGIRFGMASNDGSWFAAFRRGTPPGRFASCDLYPVYSSCPSRPPPGISRDVCGYLTRENNLRGYIVLAGSGRGVGRACLSPRMATDIAARANIEIAPERLSWDAWREKNGCQSRKEIGRCSSFVSIQSIFVSRLRFCDFLSRGRRFIKYMNLTLRRNDWL